LPKTGYTQRSTACNTKKNVSRQMNSKDDSVMTTITADLVSSFFLPRKTDSHKGTFGGALIAAGSERFFGAPILAARAALRSGCGLCTLATLPRVIEAAAATIPEAVFCALQDDPAALDAPLLTTKATACGMGLGQDARAEAVLLRVLQNSVCPLVLDADALNLLSSRPALKARITGREGPPRALIFTPHTGELCRLAGIRAENREHEALLAAALAKEFSAIVVLKGHHTLVIAPNGAVYKNSTGNPGLARGGSGDVLSGMIVSLCARFMADYPADDAALNAAIAGVFLHGLAADIACERLTQEAMIPSDVIELIPDAFKQILKVNARL
jgi:NAD(P)H-hydrate epimerase